MLLSLDLPPGVFRNGTQYQSRGRFYDADLWRWFQQTQQPVGGWRLKSSSPVSGKGRALITWVDNSNQTWAAIGTNEGLFVYSRDGTLYDITPAGFVAGPADASTGGGFGTGLFGAGLFGTPRPDNENVIPAMVWTLGTWGEVLIACDGETIYEWQLNTANPATPLDDGTTAPGTNIVPSAGAILVTDEGAIVALYARGDPRKVEWCDPENRYDWAPSSTNLAGGVLLQTQGQLLCGKRTQRTNILHTDIDAYQMTYAPGSPDVYEFQRLGSGCGIASRQAAAVVDGREFFMGSSRFWVNTGASIAPLESDVGDFVFSDMNRGQISKVTAVHNSEFSEVWFFYPSESSIENDRYVLFNYEEGHWSIGALDRLCGTDRGTSGQYMLMVDGEGYLYEHEVGDQKDGRRPFAQSGPVEIGSGETTVSIYDVIPDEKSLGDVDVFFANRDWTMSPETVIGPVSLTDRTNVRFNTRQVSIKMEAKADVDFRVGTFRFNAKQGSRR